MNRHIDEDSVSANRAKPVGRSFGRQNKIVFGNGPRWAKQEIELSSGQGKATTRTPIGRLAIPGKATANAKPKARAAALKVAALRLNPRQGRKTKAKTKARCRRYHIRPETPTERRLRTAQATVAATNSTANAENGGRMPGANRQKQELRH